MAVYSRDAQNPGVALFADVTKLWDVFVGAEVILIDIPIGLPTKIQERRACDGQARQILGQPRASSVFSAPCREALVADTHEEACRINRGVLGFGLSLQCMGIIPKIKEVDDFLHTTPDARDVIRESHPEVCFWALNGGKPMKHGKAAKKQMGITERLKVLDSVWPPARSLYEHSLRRYLRKEVARDDILDAIVLYLNSSSDLDALLTLPADRQVDDAGLPMEIVYSSHFDGPQE